MELTLKENMILNKIIGNYIIDNKLFYDECKSLNKIVNKLKEERKDIKVSYKILLDKSPITKNKIKDIEIDELNKAKQEALKELRLYDSKSICHNNWIGNRNV